MASFKLGCIKGEKGEKGLDGAKGERGDTGERGTAGAIPVFEIENVESVSYAESASVEINVENPENPKLSFRIPRGKDGKDTMGDMVSGIYDTEGKKTDVYKFAEELFGKALLKSGGNVIGKLCVHTSPESESCVRNILFSTSLPENAENGDICFVVPEDDENTIYNNGVGSVLLIPEGDEKREYIVAAKDYHGEGNVTLIRKRMPEYTHYFNRSVIESYFYSDVDNMLETVYSRLFPDYIQKIMKAPIIANHRKRHCFLPSCQELGEMEYFINNPTPAQTDAGTNRAYLTRDINDRRGVNTVNSSGKIVSVTQSTESGIRPIIVIDGSLVVRNCVHNDNAAVEAVQTNKCYYFINGKWKELML